MVSMLRQNSCGSMLNLEHTRDDGYDHGWVWGMTMHRITMTYEASNPHTGESRAGVQTDRDGSLDHACETFRAS